MTLRSSSRSPIFVSARCIAAKRLAFSPGSDSAHARNSEMNGYSRTSVCNTADSPPMTCGGQRHGHGVERKSACH